MKNSIRLNPPTDNVNGFAASGNSCCTYGSGRYKFSSPTPQRKYVHLLDAIFCFNRTGRFPTRNEIKLALHMPLNPGWGSSTWNALHKAGLIAHSRVGNGVVYRVTSVGERFLKQLKNAD